MERTAFFEIDLKNGKILFAQAGVLKNYVELHKLYNYNEIFNIITENLVFTEDRQDFIKFNIVERIKKEKSNQTYKQEFRLLENGKQEYEWYSMNVMYNYSSRRAFGTIENIHKQKSAQLEMKYQAEHDPLTGLLNRAAFQTAITAFADKKINGMYMLFDIDNFKRINDTKGHEFGDFVLCSVAREVKNLIPVGAIIGRCGGDEFHLFIPGMDEDIQASKTAKEIQEKIAALRMENISVTISMGISYYPEHGDMKKGGFQKCADIAMYHTKENGKNGFSIYHSGMGKEVPGKGSLRLPEKANQMRKNTEWLQNNRKALLSFLCLCAGMVLLLLALTGAYTKKLQEMIDNESYGYLEEISAQINTNLSKEMSSNHAVLTTLGNKVEQNTEWPLEKILKDLNSEKEMYAYREIALIDKDGNWCSNRINKVLSELIPCIVKMKNGKEFVISEIVSIEGKECLVFFSSINPITIEGREFIGIGAAVEISLINDMISLTLFGGQGYAHVVTEKGNVVIRSAHKNNDFLGYSLFSYLEDSQFYDGVTVSNIKEDFLGKHSRKIHYIKNDVDTLSIYSPVGYEDWYLFVVIPANILTEKSQGFYYLTILMCAVISGIFVALVLVLFIFQIKSKEKLLNALYTDRITEGSSMVKFESEVRQIIKKSTHYSMIYANVERFKMINEQVGKKEADLLLKKIYEIMEFDLEEEETLARLMADHFGILIRSQSLEELRMKIIDWNEKIHQYTIDHYFSVEVVLSYGIYLIKETDKEAEPAVLLDKANLARKNELKGNLQKLRIAVYNEKLEHHIKFEQELENRQEEALQNKEFFMYLQPKYNPLTNQMTGVEALVRWITKDLGILYPDQYIPLFESNGFIIKLDQFIFEEACRFLCEMQNMGMKPIPVSVNLSRVNLGLDHFILKFVEICSRYGIDHKLLEFEITENLIYENLEHLNEIIREIHSYGFRVSMDDFGSGYSSLNMLKDVDVDIVKLDKNFFGHDLNSSGKAITIVKHVIELAKDLGMIVVAEGVEYEEEVDFLKQQRCNLIQGFYYSKPVPAGQILKLLEKQLEEKKI